MSLDLGEATREFCHFPVLRIPSIVSPAVFAARSWHRQRAATLGRRHKPDPRSGFVVRNRSIVGKLNDSGSVALLELQVNFSQRSEVQDVRDDARQAKPV